jgi:hypothetical protein
MIKFIIVNYKSIRLSKCHRRTKSNNEFDFHSIISPTNTN